MKQIIHINSSIYNAISNNISNIHRLEVERHQQVCDLGNRQCQGPWNTHNWQKTSSKSPDISKITKTTKCASDSVVLVGKHTAMRSQFDPSSYPEGTATAGEWATGEWATEEGEEEA